MGEFTCERCGLTYPKTRSDEECWKEMYELMPEAIHHETAVICDDCFKEFMEWFKTLTESDKKKMREKYNSERKAH